MYIIIMGCGRVGARVALMLTTAGHEVTIMDIQSSAFTRLGSDFKGTTVLGDATDQEVLKRAGIDRADAFLAATQGDNRNIMASQIAKHVFGVKRVVTRIYDPLRSDTFAALGLQAISPTIIGANAFYEELTGQPASTVAI
ncbi:MAG: TrkA family potassium uptake protein [Chloroflexi bacterium]|nr:TrkA family potassium uptake protein [Chloroflexota bacterium]MBV9600775.1 TrkA family potassium uptake protein [Chloroflexota bacterium]